VGRLNTPLRATPFGADRLAALTDLCPALVGDVRRGVGDALSGLGHPAGVGTGTGEVIDPFGDGRGRGTLPAVTAVSEMISRSGPTVAWPPSQSKPRVERSPGWGSSDRGGSRRRR